MHRGAYGWSVGIEVWAFSALIVILAVYLLPYLVGRREMTGRSNIQDRYSAELRVLATGAAAPARDSACESSGHAELFRRRPKVRAMNRPAVRNVRAMRTERELTHVRKAHAQARERRRVAASHRGVVACVLLGVTLGAWVLGLFTALPWWPALVPTALLGASMAAGRRAAMASAAADGRERRRIAELERELMGLTGRRPSTPVVAATSSEEAFRGRWRRDGAVDGAVDRIKERSGGERAAGSGISGTTEDAGAQSSAASVTTVRASLPEILEELRAENAERDKERARRAASRQASPQRDAQEAARASRDEASGPLERGEQVAESRDEAEAQALAEIARAERALRGSAAASRGGAGRVAEEASQSRGVEERSSQGGRQAASAGEPSPQESSTERAESPEDAGGIGFHDAVDSFEAVSPAWSQIVPQGERDGGAQGSARPAEYTAARHSRHSSPSGGSAASRPRAGERRGAEERRWSMSAESAEAVAARAAGRAGESAAETQDAGGQGAARAAAPRRSIKKDATAAFPDKTVVKEPTTATPPQGWRPIQVPAPTYTLAARAPKRVFAEPVVEEGASAPVPARPQSVRTFSAPDFSEQDFHPIDLDAILERRRAAGE